MDHPRLRSSRWPRTWLGNLNPLLLHPLKMICQYHLREMIQGSESKLPLWNWAVLVAKMMNSNMRVEKNATLIQHTFWPVTTRCRQAHYSKTGKNKRNNYPSLRSSRGLKTVVIMKKKMTSEETKTINEYILTMPIGNIP